jgi:hypothetical protein
MGPGGLRDVHTVAGTLEEGHLTKTKKLERRTYGVKRVLLAK